MDYVPINESIVFPPNITEVHLNLSIIDDRIVEGFEFLSVEASLDGVAFLSPFIIIEDNDSKLLDSYIRYTKVNAVLLSQYNIVLIKS